MASPDLNAAMARFDGPFIEAADLMSREDFTVTIENVIEPMTEKDARNKLIDKPILVLRGAKKRLIVGKTNVRMLKALHGAKATEWIGKEIKIGVRYLEEAFGERNVPTVRILPTADVPAPMAVRKHLGSKEPIGAKPRRRTSEPTTAPATPTNESESK